MYILLSVTITYDSVNILLYTYMVIQPNCCLPFHVGVVSRLATAIYVAMVTPILYDNSSSLNDSNLKYESYRPYG